MSAMFDLKKKTSDLKTALQADSLMASPQHSDRGLMDTNKSALPGKPMNLGGAEIKVSDHTVSQHQQPTPKMPINYDSDEDLKNGLMSKSSDEHRKADYSLTRAAIANQGRVSIMHIGDAYNKRKIEREALSKAMADYKGVIPMQMWYDSLRSTDDGRFSQVSN